MRIASLLLLIMLAIGCGNGVPKQNQGAGWGGFPASITALTPNSAPVNSVPFTMNVDGENFGPDAILIWNGATQHTTPVSGKELLVTVISDDLTFAGAAQVYVRTGGSNSNTVQFAVVP
jgi:hypothetical protein